MECNCENENDGVVDTFKSIITSIKEEFDNLIEVSSEEKVVLRNL